MTDMQQYYADNHTSKPQFTDVSDLRRWTTDCTCAVCKVRSVDLVAAARSNFEDYQTATRVDNPELTDHKYLLCPFEIPAFVFKTRSWGEDSYQSLKNVLCTN